MFDEILKKKNVLKKNNKLSPLRSSVCNWTREGNDLFRAWHPFGPIPLSQKNKIISYLFFCINNFKWIMVKFWNSWEIKHFIFVFINKVIPSEAMPKAEPIDSFAKSSGIRTTKVNKKFWQPGLSRLSFMIKTDTFF